jgi:Methyltransferase domain
MSDDCRLCRAVTRSVGVQRLLGKYDVEYFTCAQCELIQTESPYWLQEAYTRAISALDTGAVTRNQNGARLTAALAALLDVDAKSPCLDYGGGHGVFVRMMRDLGRNFRWCDKYADNLFALGFEGDAAEHHALVTAFEVLEHLVDVRGDLERLFAGRPDHVLVGTMLHEGHQAGWWYYLLDSGQHVAVFSRRTLQWIADTFEYNVLTGAEFSLFSRRDLSLSTVRRALVRGVIQRPGVTTLLPRRVLQKQSLVALDYDAMRLRHSDTP